MQLSRSYLPLSRSVIACAASCSSSTKLGSILTSAARYFQHFGYLCLGVLPPVDAAHEQLGLAEFAEYCLRTLRLLPELGLAALFFHVASGEICSLSQMLGSLKISLKFPQLTFTIR